MENQLLKITSLTQKEKYEIKFTWVYDQDQTTHVLKNHLNIAIVIIIEIGTYASLQNYILLLHSSSQRLHQASSTRLISTKNEIIAYRQIVLAIDEDSKRWGWGEQCQVPGIENTLLDSNTLKQAHILLIRHPMPAISYQFLQKQIISVIVSKQERNVHLCVLKSRPPFSSLLLKPEDIVEAKTNRFLLLPLRLEGRHNIDKTLKLAKTNR